MDTDRSVYSGECYRHRDCGSHKLSRCSKRRWHRLHSLIHVALNVLKHDDRVIDNESYGEDDRKQSQEIYGKSKREHDRCGTNKREGNRNDGDEYSSK